MADDLSLHCQPSEAVNWWRSSGRLRNVKHGNPLLALRLVLTGSMLRLVRRKNVKGSVANPGKSLQFFKKITVINKIETKYASGC